MIPTSRTCFEETKSLFVGDIILENEFDQRQNLKGDEGVNGGLTAVYAVIAAVVV